MNNRNNPSIPSLPSRRVAPPTRERGGWTVRIVVVMTGAICFFLGVSLALAMGLSHLQGSEASSLQAIQLEHKIQQRLQAEKETWKATQAEEETNRVEKRILSIRREVEGELSTKVKKGVEERLEQLKAEMGSKQEEVVKQKVDEQVSRTCRDTTNDVDKIVAEKVKKLREELELDYHKKLDKCESQNKNGGDSARNGVPLFPQEQVGRFAAGMARTSKENFTNYLDLGVPVDPPASGSSDVLILYARHNAIPTGMERPESVVNIPDATKALENCDYVNVVLTDRSGQRKQCVALVPQYEAYHIFKYMRIDDTTNKLDSDKGSLQLVSRGYQSNGRNQFAPPHLTDTKKNWDMLQTYLQNLDDVLEELKIILEKVARDNAVVVMVVNFGQSELLMNFVCAAKARGFDISNVLVFVTDKQTKDLVEGLGLAAFFDHRNFGDIPEAAAGAYGDRKFVAMMMAKVICVQLVSMLGYDFLFSDVDMVWFKDPLDYFLTKADQNFDVYFQDDGGHSIRYAPYSANSGFYFVRHNDRTRHFLTSLLMAGDLILKTNSHQQALIAVLSEHVSLYGLKAKVFSRDTEEFPGGFHFHQKSGKYMHQFFAGEVHPYIFHMSWTHSKDNKLLFFKQMGEWYVQEGCIGKQLDEIEGEDIPGICCSAQPLVSCHYRDKPSKMPCKDSPPIDKGGGSFW